MNKTKHLKKFFNIPLICNECKSEFNSAHQKLHIGKKGKCNKCDERIIVIHQCDRVLFFSEQCPECKIRPVDELDEIIRNIAPLI